MKISDKLRMSQFGDKLRMSQFGAIGAFLLFIIWLVQPQQIEVVLYKAALLTLFAHLGYWIDRRMFWYSRCGDVAADIDIYWQIRRAIIVAAVIIGGCLAL